MIKRLIWRLLARRHYWRHVGFDELSELYVSSMFRALALSLIGIFAPMFLLQLGYPLHDILCFYGYLFAARAVGDVIAGFLVAKWGPKHTILCSYVLQIVTSGLFMTLPSQHWPLYVIAALWGLSMSLFFIAYHVDFSKVKHSDHGGKELGWVSIMERAGRAVGPVAGGLVATFFGPQYTFFVAVVMLCLALVPLFLSAEPIKTNQKLDFKGLVPGMLKRDLFAFSALHLENTISVVMWPIFLAFFVLSGYVYAELGLLSSVSMVCSMVAAYAIGRLIDNHHGRRLLRYSTIANAVVHLFRPFVNSVPMALGTAVSNELVTAGYWLPFYKGVYDNADSWPGHRIVYIVTMEFFGEIMKTVVCFSLAILAIYHDGRTVLSVAFVIGAIASLLIMTEKFHALDPRGLLFDRLRRL